METKTQAAPTRELARDLISIGIVAIVIIFLGIAVSIPTRPLAYEPWAFLAAPVSLVLGIAVAWIPRKSLPTPHVFTGALGAIIVSLSLFYFDPILRDPLLPAGLAVFLMGLRTAMLSTVMFWLPSFIRALGATFAAERQTR